MFNIPQNQLEKFCETRPIQRLFIFGSALRDDFNPDSDIDLLIELNEDTTGRLKWLIRLEEELTQLLGRKVDLGEYEAVIEDPNYIRRRSILGSARVIYER
jgi:uncharacterized protein